MNSSGSNDSMFSINSGYSDDSMEYLSAEERACLMYLEETIESLEAQDDSGLSNDESHILENKITHLSSINQPYPVEVMSHDDPNRVLGKDNKRHNLRVPTPLVLANGNSKFGKKPVLLPSKHNSPVKSYNSAALLGVKNGPLLSPSNTETSKSNGDHPNGQANLPPSFIPEPPFKSGFLNGAKGKECTTKSSVDQRLDQATLELFPPPSDFKDEQPFLNTQNQAQLQQLQPTLPLQLGPEFMRISPPPNFAGHDEPDKPLNLAESSRSHWSPGDINNLYKKASIKKAPEKPTVIVAAQKAPQNFLTTNTDASLITKAEHAEPKSPPAVAPKPKKLPSNIVLNTHKEHGPGHLPVATNDRLMNQQKVHMEALKKLGLLKGDEIDSGISLNPPQKITSQPSRTFTIPTPRHESLTTEQQSLQELHGNRNVLLRPLVKDARPQNPKPFEIKSVPMDKSFSLKSHTLERMSTPAERSPERSNVELLPEQTQKPRSRVASTGSWKDFGIDKVPSELNRETNISRSRHSVALPSLKQPSMDPPKPLRSHGISVVISPQNKSEGDRNLALKKLGLFKN